MPTELIRVPSRQYAKALHHRSMSMVGAGTMSRYDYTTPDGRWYVEKNRGCGGGWTVIDTTGRYVCTSCFYNDERHTTIAPTLIAAKAFISEWSI